jgi:F0F1-type ATP synthase assembly protein I
MRSRIQVSEITGSCAQVWNGVLIPTTGTISVRIDGDNLHTTVKSGLEKKESWTRIQNLDSIEIHAAPIYILLILGVLLGILGLVGLVTSLTRNESPIFAFALIIFGVVLVVMSIIQKQRYIAIYSLRYTIPLFMKGSLEPYQQFAIQVMALADKLNKPNPVNP